MTLDNQPIKNGLRSAVEIYLYAMRPFTVRCLRQVKGTRIEDTVRAGLNGDQRNQFDRNLGAGKSVEDSIDVGHFVFLVKNNWNEVFYTAFAGDRSVHNLVANVKHLRNRLAHPSQKDIEQDIAPEYARKCLAEIADMLGRINCPDEKKLVEDISDGLFSASLSAGVAFQEAVSQRNEKPEEPEPSLLPAAVAYWVYEDGPTNQTRIHKATCRFCNDGRGLHGSRLPDNRWIGPLESAEVALDVAMDTERKNIAECKICRPLQ